MNPEKQTTGDTVLDDLLNGQVVDEILSPTRRTRSEGSQSLPREILRKRAEGEWFISGAPRCEELFAAVELGKDAIRLYLCLCHVRGVAKNEYIRPNQTHYKFWDIDGPRRQRGLKRLEAAGLISVIRHKGSLPVIRMIWRDIDPEKFAPFCD